VTSTEIAPLPADRPKFQLKRLTPKHKQVAALLAQGLGRQEVAKICGFTPEYLTMLAQQDLFVAYVKEMSAFVDVRMQALHERAVDVLGTSMQNGSDHVKLAAAQTVLKAVGKDGSKEKELTVNHFVVHVPPKATSAEEWQKARQGRILDQPKEST